MQALFNSADELNKLHELFQDIQRSDEENTGPYVMVYDNFYKNPDEIRQLALQQEFYQYRPPLIEQVGQKIASQYPDPKPVWLASSLLRYFGKTVTTPQAGYRYATAEVRSAIENILHEEITTDTWHEMGDWWNGAFHLQYKATSTSPRFVHHHYKKGDIYPRGWGGLVYLSPTSSNSPSENGSGTTIWRHKVSQRCIATQGAHFNNNTDEFELALNIKNRYNRLILFRENVLHRAGDGFGDKPENGRLTQTFFFQSQHKKS